MKRVYIYYVTNQNDEKYYDSSYGRLELFCVEHSILQPIEKELLEDD